MPKTRKTSKRHHRLPMRGGIDPLSIPYSQTLEQGSLEDAKNEGSKKGMESIKSGYDYDSYEIPENDSPTRYQKAYIEGYEETTGKSLHQVIVMSSYSSEPSEPDESWAVDFTPGKAAEPTIKSSPAASLVSPGSQSKPQRKTPASSGKGRRKTRRIKKLRGRK